MLPTRPAPKNILQKAFEVRDQIHLWHLQTKSYSEHKALDTFYNEWLDLVDSFIESYQGKYGRIEGGLKIEVVPYCENCSIPYLTTLRTDLISGGAFRNILSNYDTDMNNILDEMLALVNKTLYLLTLV